MMCDHNWVMIGGSGCCPIERHSVPVYECTLCGACDYGYGREGDEQRRYCESKCQAILDVMIAEEEREYALELLTNL